MSLDTSDPPGNNQPNRGNQVTENNRQVGSFENLMLVMLEENRRRDEQHDILIERLFHPVQISTTTAENAETSHSITQNCQVMPDLSKNIESFSGSESSTHALEWLSNIV